MRAASWVLLLAPRAAHAFCQQTTDLDTCQDAARPIAWADPCLAYSIHEAGSPDVPLETVRAVVRASAGAWEAATREGEAVPCTDFRFDETDLATCSRVEYRAECGNVNVILFRERGWVSERGHDRAAIALSTIYFTSGSARIVSTDMELNGEFYRFDHRDSYEGCGDEEGGCPADLQNTVTHELGHFVGLSHVADPEATMDFAEIPGDTNKRDLAADDVEGMCAIYPAGAGGASCDGAPPGGLDLVCAECDTGCCTAAPGAPGGRRGAVVVVAVVVVVAGRRWMR